MTYDLGDRTVTIDKLVVGFVGVVHELHHWKGVPGDPFLDVWYLNTDQFIGMHEREIPRWRVECRTHADVCALAREFNQHRNTSPDAAYVPFAVC